MTASLPITVDTHLRIRRADLRAARLTLSDVRTPFEYPNPEYFKKDRMGFYTGNVPRVITLVEQDAEEVRLPRGVWERLARSLARKGVRPVVEDRTVSGTIRRGLDTSWHAPFALHPDQRSAAKACVRRRSGIVLGPCASGKTEIALRAISDFGERSIVLVHTEQILLSWVAKARERLPGYRVGAFYGKRKQPDADLVVGMIKSVLNRVRSDPDWAASFGCLILDEAHHAPASTFAETVQAFPAKYRLAFTATPKRKDGKEVLFYDAFGAETKRSARTGKSTSAPRVLFKITDAMLDRYGRIIPIDVVVVPTKFRFDLNLVERLRAEGWGREPGESAVKSVQRWADEVGFAGSLNAYADMLDAMVRDKSRQARVLSYLLPEMAAEQTCLLLADRRELGLEIRAWLRRRKIDVGVLMGGRQKREAERTVEALASGALRVAVGTTVADEGMDVGQLSRGFGCTPVGSNPGRLTQQFGRFKRRAEGKVDATYFYFWDELVAGLRHHLRAVRGTVSAPHRIWWSEEPGKREPLTAKLVRELEAR